MPSKNLKVYSFITKQKIKVWKKISSAWENYFQIKHTILNPSEFDNNKRKSIDVLFLDFKSLEIFKLVYYKTFKDINSNFKLVVIKSKKSDDDYSIYKRHLADDIVFLDSTKQNIKWKSIAILRRRWDEYSKPSTIIYKDIIIDLLKDYISVNSKEIDLTKIELKLFKLFLMSKGEYISKERILKHVWKIDDIDRTRIVDQMLHKLKNKIGVKYFKTARHKGVKFE